MQSIIDEKIDRLAQTVENVISVLNPDKVIVYGNMFEVSGIPDRFIGACREYDPELPDGYIIKSSLNDRTDFIGALAIVMDEFFF